MALTFRSRAADSKNFSTVLYTGALHSIYTRALTFENLFQTYCFAAEFVGNERGGRARKTTGVELRDACICVPAGASGARRRRRRRRRSSSSSSSRSRKKNRVA
jgi:hypothetical protein